MFPSTVQFLSLLLVPLFLGLQNLLWTRSLEVESTNGAGAGGLHLRTHDPSLGGLYDPTAAEWRLGGLGRMVDGKEV